MFPDTSSSMGLDCSYQSSLSSSRMVRMSLTPVRLRLKEERKKIIRALEAKYRGIDDHERGMRRFVLIKNNLRRLQREAREEKIARQRAGLSGSRVSNLSPSCLSASSRPQRSPSPPMLDYGYPDSPRPMASEESLPNSKRPRLLFDDDKENEMEVDAVSTIGGEVTNTGSSKNHGGVKPLDDAQEILRDLYETCVNDGLSPPSSTDSSHDASLSLSMQSVGSTNLSTSEDNNNDSSDCWARHSHYPFNCGQSSLLGNDLQSVVFHSLMTSLES